ncbi:MAG TPA: hypothetical protein VF803_00960 [Candidatus Paceibacterota bacterium]
MRRLIDQVVEVCDISGHAERLLLRLAASDKTGAIRTVTPHHLQFTERPSIELLLDLDVVHTRSRGFLPSGRFGHVSGSTLLQWMQHHGRSLSPMDITVMNPILDGKDLFLFTVERLGESMRPSIYARPLSKVEIKQSSLLMYELRGHDPHTVN